MNPEEFDIIIIGGGINGAAIAREAQTRGLRVILLEKNDFASGTTQYSSRLIHGGLRYLEQFEFGLVFEALQEREYLLKTAPHLVRPLHFLIPNYLHSTRDLWYLRLGMIGYDFLSFLKSLPWHTYWKNANLVKLVEPGIETAQLNGAVAYYDGQVNFPERLCLANILSAQHAGAIVKNYHHVTKILTQNKTVIGVQTQDLLTKQQQTYYASLVINASGPWVDQTNELIKSLGPLSLEIGGTKGSHIVVKPWKSAPRRAIYVEAYHDRRPIFIIPWRKYILIGTTDIPFHGKLETVYPTTKEAQYFLDETNRLFPDAQLTTQKIIHAYAGVRPLPSIRKEAPGDIPRSHIIHDYQQDGITGYLSIISGKITTNRSLAQETINTLQSKLPPHIAKKIKRSQTKSTPLFGGSIKNIEQYCKDNLSKIENTYHLDREQAQYLIDMFGTEHQKILAYCEHNKSLNKRISQYHPDILAQIYYCIEHEHVKTLSDFLLRRTGIGSGENQGLDCIQTVAKIMAPKLNWTAQHTKQQIQQYKKEIKIRYTLHN